MRSSTALYVPKAWASDPARRTAAHIPEAIEFATKPRIARGMIEHAIAAPVPFAWVAADTVYGVGEIEMALRRAGRGYVLGVAGVHQVRSWGVPFMVGTAETVARTLPDDAWQGLSAGDGTKGPRLHDWAYLELAHLGADEYVDGAKGLWTRGLGSCPNAWCRTAGSGSPGWGWAACQAATGGKLTGGVSLNGARVSRLM